MATDGAAVVVGSIVCEVVVGPCTAVGCTSVNAVGSSGTTVVSVEGSSKMSVVVKIRLCTDEKATNC